MEGTHVYLAENTSGGSGGILTFLPILLLFAALYFLMIRPQSKRRREAAQMQSQLGPGDEVQTIGGLFGTVVSADDESVTIEAAPGVPLRFVRGAIARVVTSATTDTDDASSTADDESVDTPTVTEKG